MRSTIAVIGPIAGGKGSIGELLINRGYSQFTYRAEVQKEVLRRGLPLERAAFQDVSDSLRVEFGADILARRIAASIEQARSQGSAEKAIIDGLRHPHEVQWVKDNFRTRVIGVTAPPEIRFQRLLTRARGSDTLTREGFELSDRRDRGIGQPEYGQQGDACLPLADFLIENTGTPGQLEQNLGEVLVSLGIEGPMRTRERR